LRCSSVLTNATVPSAKACLPLLLIKWPCAIETWLKSHDDRIWSRLSFRATEGDRGECGEWARGNMRGAAALAASASAAAAAGLSQHHTLHHDCLPPALYGGLIWGASNTLCWVLGGSTRGWAYSTMHLC
jgi:hypothetical protein